MQLQIQPFCVPILGAGSKTWKIRGDGWLETSLENVSDWFLKTGFWLVCYSLKPLSVFLWPGTYRLYSICLYEFRITSLSGIKTSETPEQINVYKISNDKLQVYISLPKKSLTHFLWKQQSKVKVGYVITEQTEVKLFNLPFLWAFIWHKTNYL